MTLAVVSRVGKPERHLGLDEVAQSLQSGLGVTCYSRIARQDSQDS